MDKNKKRLENLTMQIIQPAPYLKAEKPRSMMLDGDDCYLCQAERIQILQPVVAKTNIVSR